MGLTGHYLNSILERRTVDLQEKAAELEALCVAQYDPDPSSAETRAYVKPGTNEMASRALTGGNLFTTV